MAEIKFIHPITGEMATMKDDGTIVDSKGNLVKANGIKEAIKKLKEEDPKWQNK